MTPSPKIVFCLTTSGDDYYPRMTHIAVQSVRYFMPSASITIMVDRKSVGHLQASELQYFESQSTIYVIDTPDGNPTSRNRWMKTSLRMLLDGDFLYLDSDVVIRGDISRFWLEDGDFIGILERDDPATQFGVVDRSKYLSLGWELPAHGSVNGGVLFWRDTVSAHKLAQRYHQRWIQTANVLGRSIDQPALNKAIADSDIQLGLLPAIFNSIERDHRRCVKEAKIWHFLFSNFDNETKKLCDPLGKVCAR